MNRCLVVDDDGEIRDSVRDYLQRFGMAVTTASCGAEMRRLVQSGTFDVIVLDLMLPDDNGLALCRWVQDTAGTPVIMLTAQGDPASRVLGLEVGADDYLAKPFEPRELVARINAVLRRAQKGERGKEDAQRVVQFKGWKFDRLLRQLVSPQDVVVALSSAEYRLLAAFVERPGRVLSRDQLIDLTRAPGVEVNDRSIDLAVSRLRQKLGDSSREPLLIKTMRGEGYLFDVKVQA
ncbi:response regulator transcription factor [Aquabacterium sp. CECT 9606]|uniref:response regulator transcription factor n=1 Tax=Aquabacterium sp. CECT 9606 TaxID=2845822 RepID=UPI001EF9BE2F|nr:response regulator transcription factor [Aquabacterium sp. CECT 9606]CAH0348044.1 Transcriptional regulatory protein OmpR [Aquabacterium sp. CECT 9606]